MDIYQFFVAGINYKKTDASLRGNFAVCPAQYNAIIQKASQRGICELFILSTCNRTEIYAVTSSVNELTELLCTETNGDPETFKQRCYIKQGPKAVEHLYHVAAGLDSQILGDYEIVGQLKQAVQFARARGAVGTLLERITNGVLKSSKVIKNCTQLSGGTVSVAFAAIQFLKNRVEDIQHKKILLIGTGKIGSSTCKNLVDYVNNNNITLINRTAEKAEELAGELHLRSAPYENLYSEIKDAHIIIVSANASRPIIAAHHLQGTGKKVLIDLSIPNNIDASVKELPGILLANVDELSRINDETLQKRQGEIPKAKAIIAAHMQEFKEWYFGRKHVPVLVAVKEKLIAMHDCSLYTSAPLHEQKPLQPVNATAVQKVINTMAVKMRSCHQPGCNYIEAINEYIGSTTN